MSIPAKALTAERVYRRCDFGKLGFTSTAEIQPPRTAIGQDRALGAIEFSTEMEHFGYNLFVFGAGGSGKHGIVLHHIRTTAAGRTAPDDWCYVTNFTATHKPCAMRLPIGRARPFANDTELLIENLKASLLSAFESDE